LTNEVRNRGASDELGEAKSRLSGNCKTQGTPLRGIDSVTKFRESEARPPDPRPVFVIYRLNSTVYRIYKQFSV
jgi:hypothetical protein